MPLILNGDGSVGPLSATEVGYLDGVTSAVQTQINSKVTTPGVWTSYTPVMTSSGTAPTLGSGATQVGAYTQIGKTVFWNLKIQFGSGMNAGTGYYYFSLPVTAKESGHSVGFGVFLDMSAQSRTTLEYSLATNTIVEIHFTGTSWGAFSATNPVVIAQSDIFLAQGVYEAA